LKIGGKLVEKQEFVKNIIRQSAIKIFRYFTFYKINQDLTPLSLLKQHLFKIQMAVLIGCHFKYRSIT